MPESKTKAGARYAPMTNRLRRKLLEQIGAWTAGWLFPSPRYPGRPIQRQALTVAWRKAADKAGVDVNLYCARHMFGPDVMEATKNQFQLMKVRDTPLSGPPSGISITKRQKWVNCRKRRETYARHSFYATVDKAA